MIDMFKHLLPTGRAWRLTINKRLRQFFDGLTGLISDTRTEIDLYYDDIDPQTTRELARWESQFGLLPALLTEQQRRDRLDSAWKPQLGQSPRAIQDALQAAGFDVYVHEWWVPIAGRPAGGSVNGDAVPVSRDPFTYLFDGFGPTALGYPLVNKIQIATVSGTLIGCGHNDLYCAGNLAFAGSGGSDITYSFKKYTMPADINTYQYYIYIGGPVFPDHATIQPDRKNEFESLCLKICPLEQWLGILADYAGTDSNVVAVPINFADVINFDVWGEFDYSLDGGATFTSASGQDFNISGIPTGDVIVNAAGGGITQIQFLFKDFFTSIKISESTGSITSAAFMFHGCSSLTSLDLSNFNTSAITNMYGMFGSCSSLTSLDLSNFNTSAVTSMDYMFRDCSLISNLNLTSFDMSSVTGITYMFDGCSDLVCITNIDSTGANTSFMFDGTPSLVAPNSSDQTLILNGADWVNPGQCP